MREHNTIPGSVYAVTCSAGCTLTDDNGMNETVEAGKQFRFMAQAAKVYTSEPATVTKGNFKYAPAEMLGLLGGGVSELPKGYIRAEFLENAEKNYINLPVQTIAGDSISWLFDVQYTQFTEGKQAEGKNGIPYFFCGVNKSEWYWGANEHVLNTGVQADFAWHKIELSYSPEFTGLRIDNATFTTIFNPENVVIPAPAYMRLWLAYSGASNCYNRKKTVKIKVNNTTIYDLLPCVDRVGVPAYFNAVTGETFRRAGLIVGFTLPQARQLSKLPAGGGELTISLPSNWQDDAAVVAALATAEANGWVLTIQTYEAEGGAVSTFSLRRIWVRKRAEQNGSYVATGGTRWQVEWCATMVGGAPQEHGYEPFRSVEAAAAYWELQPYVYPEEEQLLTN